MIRFDEYLLITNFVVTKMIDYYGNMNKPTALELRLDQELDQLLIDLYKDEEPITVSSTDRALSEDEEKIWRQILLDEDDGDTDSNESNVDKKASISTTKISEKPLALRNKVGKPSFTVAVETPSSDLDDNLSDFQKRIIKRVQEAQAYEVKIFNDINTEAFRATRFDAVIDWLDLKFTVDPKKCDFCFKPKARSFIKAFITRQTGIRHYVADKSEVIQDGASFTIRLHDVNNRKELGRIVKILTKQYGCKVEEMTIEAIELSFDLYNAQNSALLIALHKSLKYPKVVNHMRIYKTKGTAKAVPDSPHELYALLEDGYNLATGDHRFEEFCTRMYIKRTDKNGTPLPLSKHRLRAEVTLRKTVFEKAKIDCGLDNLSMLITHGFKKLTFTKLSNRATDVDRKNYRDLVLPFGQEQHISRSSNGHQRPLLNGIESYGLLNERKRLAVKALADKFKVRKNR